MADFEQLEESIARAQLKQKNQSRWKNLSTVFAIAATVGGLLSAGGTFYAQKVADQARLERALAIEKLRAELKKVPVKPPIKLTIIVGDPVSRFATQGAGEGGPDSVLTLSCASREQVADAAMKEAPPGTRFDRVTLLSTMPGGACGFSVFTAIYVPDPPKTPSSDFSINPK